jgi:peptidoglycan/LPS O-acetylase OafA/YrhL
MGVKMLDFFPIWLGGTALLVIRPPSFPEIWGRRIRLIAALLYAPLPFVFANVRSIPEHVGDYLFAAATLVFLWILLSANQRCDERAARVRASRTLARFSYSLYALHTPLLIFLASLVVGDNRWDPGPVHIAAALAVLAIIPVYAFVAASLTEFHTDALRRRLEGWLRLPAASSGLASNPIAPSPVDLPQA